MTPFLFPSLVAVGAAAGYWFLLRRWFARWGTTAEDRHRTMPGDAAVTAPTYVTTLAITVDAAPAHVWPWLAQMGYQRGGLYSYDWLDRLFGYLDRPSATRVLPEFQQLRVGDEIPVGRGAAFPVTAVDPARALVLSGMGDDFAWAWQFGLYPLNGRQTRLVSRNQVRVPKGLGSWLFMRVIEPAAFLMTRRMLIGIKQRAERLAAAAEPAPQRAA
jgi:hypothetical protein